ncbi:hypothetical protein BSNK01_00090 [Bacillaceae bacterium]
MVLKGLFFKYRQQKKRLPCPARKTHDGHIPYDSDCPDKLNEKPYLAHAVFEAQFIRHHRDELAVRSDKNAIVKNLQVLKSHL